MYTPSTVHPYEYTHAFCPVLRQLTNTVKGNSLAPTETSLQRASHIYLVSISYHFVSACMRCAPTVTVVVNHRSGHTCHPFSFEYGSVGRDRI